MPSVRLTSFDEVLATLDRLEADPPPMKANAGHGLLHCATSIESSMHGYPRLMSAPFRFTVGKLAKWVFLRRGYMKHDTDQGTPGSPPLPQDTPVPEAIARLRAAIAAFRAHDGPMHPHVAYGSCTKTEYEKIHSMHVANHIDDVVPPGWGGAG